MSWQTDVPSAEALPIPDYDELSASQVVERLEGLDHDSLDAIRRYETEHRAATPSWARSRSSADVEASRPASADDIPRVVELAELMRAELGAMRGGALWVEREAWPEPLGGRVRRAARA